MGRMLAYRRMKRLLATALMCLVAPVVEGEDALAVQVTLAPGKMHEECARLEKNEKRKFHWKATAPVDFNIHYHEGAEIFYPVKREGMRGDGGTFTAKVTQDYCWMWTAKNAQAVVTGKIEP
jgi:hypothetical protein